MQNELNSQQLEKERLKQQQKDFKNNEEKNMRQLKMWRDLKALLDVKQKCLKQQMEDNAITEYQINNRRDHLVL